MKRLLVLLALSLGACANMPISQTLLNDGNLLIAGLQTVDSTLKTANAPATDVALVETAIAALQTAEADLQAGKQTPAGFAKLAQDEIAKFAPAVLADLHANATIVTGVTLIENLLPVIIADVTPAAPAKVGAAMTDQRQALRNWIQAAGK